MIKKLLVIAACTVLIIGIVLYFNYENDNPVPISRNENASTVLEPILAITYPQAYAFDDYDTRIKILEENPVDESFIEAISNFSYHTGSPILRDADQNINFSPLSLYLGISLATSGAKGKTESQFLDLLGVSDSYVLSEQCKNLYRNLYKDNEIGKLKIANSIWLDDDMNGEPIVFKEDFVKNAAKNFYASSYIVDFNSEETRKAMANWISTNTNGTITPTIETTTEQILSMINTVYFYDQWTNYFDKNENTEDVFYLLDGNETKCDYMNRPISLGSFTKGSGFTRAGLGLKNGGQMVFILPDEGVSPNDLISTPEKMRNVFEEGEEFYGEILWKIPKFSFGSKLILNEVLNNLGLESAFNSDANFSRITDHTAFISKIMQETHIAIDENGVEASAYTQIDYTGSALPQERADMVLNRPFLYGIIKPNGTLLFLGLCNNPVE